MKSRRRYPRGMVARLALVLVAALCIELAGTMVIHKWQERQLISGERTRRITEQIVSADRIAAHAAPEQRGALMSDLRIRGMQLNWVPSTVITDTSAAHPRLAQMRARIENQVPPLAGRDLRLSLIASEDGARRDLLGALRLADGSFVTFRARHFLGSSPSLAMTALAHLALVGIVMGATLLMVRGLVRPLRNLAEVADATGRGSVVEIKAEGPWEVRRVATAFAAMQARLLQMMDDHTQALVAVSHDLRTPIQRLRLRTALLEDAELREAMIADLIDMERFIGSVMELMQDGSEEEWQLVDLPSIVMTMVDNAVDAGASAEYVGPLQLPMRTRPLALKRALGNLVDNARRHAGQVRVVVEAGDPILLSVEDDGPGIPPASREDAFLPFHKLRTDRGMDSGGSGLGLAIVKKAVASLGGRIELKDSAMGGLAAVIRIPATPPDP